MKILTGIDIPFHPFGGSPLICNDWYSDLPSDTEVKFLALKPTDMQLDNWWSIKDVTFLETLKTKNADEYQNYIKSLYEEVSKIVEDFKPDVIHAQHLNFGLSRVFADLSKDIPKLGICHGTDVQWAMKEKFFEENLIYISDNLDKLLFPAENMAKDFFKIYKKEKPYVINPHGIPDNYYVNTLINPSYDGKDPLKVLYAGRLLSIKGAHIVVESLAHTRNAVELTIIGNEDEKGYKGLLKAIVKKHNLTNVIFKDQISRSNLINSFKNYDLVVFPSIAIEAFSLTSIEAQASGLPVAYAEAGGIADAVGGSGIIISPNTPQALAKIFDGIFIDPLLLKQYQLLGYENAKKFKLSEKKDKLFKITADLLR